MSDYVANCESKGVKFMRVQLDQYKLFEGIVLDIKSICAKYNFKKVIEVTNNERGVISVKIQNEVPTALIYDLDEYFGFKGVIQNYQFGTKVMYRWVED